MNFYIGTIVISIIFKLITEVKEFIYRVNNPENINYSHIGKYNILNKRNLLLNLLCNLIVLLIPGINMFTYGYALYKSSDVISRKKIEVDKERMFSLENIIQAYELQKSLSDSLKIDGLSETQIKKETVLANQEMGYTSITDKMYLDVKICEKAVRYLNEFEINESINLTREEKIKILRQYRKAFSTNSKEILKPIQKTLKIANKK